MGHTACRMRGFHLLLMGKIKERFRPTKSLLEQGFRDSMADDIGESKPPAGIAKILAGFHASFQWTLEGEGRQIYNWNRLVGFRRHGFFTAHDG